MLRVNIPERPGWEKRAHEMGFKYHTMYGDKYWDESRYYQFSLQQIEEDLEDPTRELHAMCLKAAKRVIYDEDLMDRFAIPAAMRPLVRASWERGDQSLYGRFDFVYAGNGPAKMLEYNADTPTSLYETGFWQWVWLEDLATDGKVPRNADQFNSLQEKLILRFHELKQSRPGEALHFSCVEESEEDRGTVQYLEDCASEAGIDCKFVDIEAIGEGANGEMVDQDDQIITWLFKLYPLEFMFREEYARLLPECGVTMLEPYWKAVISNKAILPLLWEMFPGHPNLLPAYYSKKDMPESLRHYVKKPIFAREGSNVSVYHDGKQVVKGEGPYGQEGWIYQALAPLPTFGEDYTLIGSWVIGDEPAGISIREDSTLVTKDMSRFIPHIIA